MYADIADYSEWKTGRRATGLIFSSSSMSQKMGWTLGSALTAWLLAAFGFQANQVQEELAQTGIRLMLSWLPAIGSVIALIMIYFYPLTDVEMQRIGTILKEQRRSENAS
jgi:GPH family glycoside/pentoside/hexuronide:cation symporter